ncbi:MAG TPA: dihydropteroate synthase [Candidatus Hydrothermia bacterium]|nr:dihydropteroate synthase [Candidatus Hydrothermia bacterium]
MNLDFRNRTLIMGILNITPDSFFDGGKFNVLDQAIKRADEMLNEGADIIDIGGESTRPGADLISIQEEMDRVLPIFSKLKGFPIPLSIDTYKHQVAEEACKLGATIINDISGLQFDPEIVNVAKKYDTYIIIMHMKGHPRDMQKNPQYGNVISEIISFLRKQSTFTRGAGVSESRIIVDPGIGFGKTLEHNILILKEIEKFKEIGFPILVGHSRKSMIGALLNHQPPDDRLYGTMAISAYLLLKRIEVLRVHDVRPHFEMREVIEALL